MRTLIQRLLFLFRRDRLTRELDEELRFHLDMKARDLAADSGAGGAGAMSDAETSAETNAKARAEAMRQVGNPLRLREAARDPWRLTSVETFAQDVRHGLRLLRRDPTFTLAALATLALGIGLNTAIFSVAYGVLWRPLPYPDPDRIVIVLSATMTEKGVTRSSTWSPGGYLDLATSPALEHVSAYTFTTAQITGHGEPLQVPGLEVTPGFFGVFGVQPLRGRTFLTGEAAAQDDRQIVISERFWHRALQGDPAIVGGTLTVDGLARTVVGILPREFSYRPMTPFAQLPDADLWIANRRSEGSRGNSFLSIVGRLAPGADRAQAEAQLTTIVRQSEKTSDDRHLPGPIAQVVGLRDEMVGGVRTLLLVLVGAVGFVLLIACVNVTNLQMARLSARRGELAVRAALGAGRRRIARQLLTEAVVLSIAGGALGVLLAQAVIAGMLPFVPQSVVPRLDEIQIDGSALAFCIGVSVLCSVLVGLLPALRTSAFAGSDALRGGESRTTTDRQGERLRTVLVAAQIALTLVLLVGAGLLMHSFVRLTSVAPGFQPETVHTVTVSLPGRLYTQAPQMQALVRTVLERVRARPAVESVSVVNSVPFGTFFLRGDFQVEGLGTPDLLVGKPKIEADYFRTMSIPLLQGREFTPQDDAGAPKVAIVSQGVARQLWPKGEADALGRRVRLGDKGEWMTVVGVVADVRQMQLTEPPQPMVYVPFQQETSPFFLQTISFVWRTTTAASAAEGVRAEIRRAAPDLPIGRIGTLDERVARTVEQPRFRTLLLALFALAATSIAACGIYGLMAYAVTQRRREIGVRVALGAAREDVLRLVLARALRIVIAGVALGVAASLMVTQVLRNFLYEITPNDPLAFTIVPLLLIGIGALAAWLPARRASRIDPAVALRAE